MASLDDLLSAMKNGVNAINALNQTMANAFPSITNVSTSSLLGSSQSVAMGTIQTSSGGTYRVLLLASS